MPGMEGFVGNQNQIRQFVCMAVLSAVPDPHGRRPIGDMSDRLFDVKWFLEE